MLASLQNGGLNQTTFLFLFFPCLFSWLLLLIISPILMSVRVPLLLFLTLELRSNGLNIPVVEGGSKAPFSLAIRPKCRRGGYSYLWIAPLSLDPYPMMLSVKQEDIKYQLLSLWNDSIWDWTPLSLDIGPHSTHYVGIYRYYSVQLNQSWE